MSFKDTFWIAAGGSVSFLLGVWLLFASLPHILNPYYFLGTVYSYEILTPNAAVCVAEILPFCQATIGICLVARVFIFVSHVFAAGLFLVFFGAQTYLRFVVGSSVCGCFGPRNETLEGFSYYLLIVAFSLCVCRIAAMVRRQSFSSSLRVGEL